MDTRSARVERDKALIDELGGPAKVAELLGFDKDGGIQRVQNWTTRGIPAAVKVLHPRVFLKDAITTKARKPAKAEV